MLQLGCCQSVLLQAVLVLCKHLFYNALLLTISCALALFDCAYDMDHESVVNEMFSDMCINNE